MAADLLETHRRFLEAMYRMEHSLNDIRTPVSVAGIIGPAADERSSAEIIAELHKDAFLFTVNRLNSHDEDIIDLMSKRVEVDLLHLEILGYLDKQVCQQLITVLHKML